MSRQILKCENSEERNAVRKALLRVFYAASSRNIDDQKKIIGDLQNRELPDLWDDILHSLPNKILKAFGVFRSFQVGHGQRGVTDSEHKDPQYSRNDFRLNQCMPTIIITDIQAEYPVFFDQIQDTIRAVREKGRLPEPIPFAAYNHWLKAKQDQDQTVYQRVNKQLEAYNLSTTQKANDKTSEMSPDKYILSSVHLNMTYNQQTQNITGTLDTHLLPSVPRFNNSPFMKNNSRMGDNLSTQVMPRVNSTPLSQNSASMAGIQSTKSIPRPNNNPFMENNSRVLPSRAAQSFNSNPFLQPSLRMANNQSVQNSPGFNNPFRIGNPTALGNLNFTNPFAQRNPFLLPTNSITTNPVVTPHATRTPPLNYYPNPFEKNNLMQSGNQALPVYVESRVNPNPLPHYPQAQASPDAKLTAKEIASVLQYLTTFLLTNPDTAQQNTATIITYLTNLQQTFAQIESAQPPNKNNIVGQNNQPQPLADNNEVTSFNSNSLAADQEFENLFNDSEGDSIDYSSYLLPQEEKPAPQMSISLKTVVPSLFISLNQSNDEPKSDKEPNDNNPKKRVNEDSPPQSPASKPRSKRLKNSLPITISQNPAILFPSNKSKMKKRVKKSSSNRKNFCCIQKPNPNDLESYKNLYAGNSDDQKTRVSKVVEWAEKSESFSVLETAECPRLVRDLKPSDPISAWREFFRIIEHPGKFEPKLSEDIKKAQLELSKKLDNNNIYKKALLATHTEEYVNHVIACCMDNYYQLDHDTKVNLTTFRALLQDFASTITNLATHDCVISLGLPTHHAHHDKASGFCIFNKVGMLIHHLQETHTHFVVCGLDVNSDDGLNDVLQQKGLESCNILHLDSYDPRVYPRQSLKPVEGPTYTYVPYELDSYKRSNPQDIHPVIVGMIKRMEDFCEAVPEEEQSKIALLSPLGFDSHENEKAPCGKSLREEDDEESYEMENTEAKKHRFNKTDFAYFYQNFYRIMKKYNITTAYIGLEGGYTDAVNREQILLLTQTFKKQEELFNESKEEVVLSSHSI